MRVTKKMIDAAAKAIADCAALGLPVAALAEAAIDAALEARAVRVPANESDQSPASVVNMGDAWLRYRTELNPEAAESTHDLWCDHTEFCIEQGVRPARRRSFSNWLTKDAPAVRLRRGTNGMRLAAGIRIKHATLPGPAPI